MPTGESVFYGQMPQYSFSVTGSMSSMAVSASSTSTLRPMCFTVIPVYISGCSRVHYKCSCTAADAHLPMCTREVLVCTQGAILKYALRRCTCCRVALVRKEPWRREGRRACSLSVAPSPRMLEIFKRKRMSERGKRGRGEETKAEGKRERRRRRGMGKKKERDYCESSVTNFRSLARVCNRLLRWGGGRRGECQSQIAWHRWGRGEGMGREGGGEEDRR